MAINHSCSLTPEALLALAGMPLRQALHTQIANHHIQQVKQSF